MQEAKARKRKRNSEGPVESSITSDCSDGSSHSTLDARDNETIEATIDKKRRRKTIHGSSTEKDLAEARAEYYIQWINSLHRHDIQVLAMMLYDDYREMFGLQKTGAAEQVGLRLGLCEKTIKRWRKTFLNNAGRF